MSIADLELNELQFCKELLLNNFFSVLCNIQ